MKEIKGDLIKLAKEGKFDYICHGCNTQSNFGAGIALQIAKNFPSANAWDKRQKWNLGEICKCYDNRYRCEIINCYTQIWYGKSNNTHFTKWGNKKVYDNSTNRYLAIRKCMSLVNTSCKGKKVGLPLIGAGLAGGSWDIIRKIIEEELINCDVTIVHYDK